MWLHQWFWWVEPFSLLLLGSCVRHASSATRCPYCPCYNSDSSVSSFLATASPASARTCLSSGLTRSRSSRLQTGPSSRSRRRWSRESARTMPHQGAADGRGPAPGMTLAAGMNGGRGERHGASAPAAAHGGATDDVARRQPTPSVRPRHRARALAAESKPGAGDRERLQQTTDGGIARRGVAVGESGAAVAERGIGIWGSNSCGRGGVVERRRPSQRRRRHQVRRRGGSNPPIPWFNGF